MRHTDYILVFFFAVLAVTVTGCQASETSQDIDETTYAKGSVGKADASIEAVFVDFDFDGELVMESCFSARRRIEDQMLYTIGQLNGIDIHALCILARKMVREVRWRDGCRQEEGLILTGLGVLAQEPIRVGGQPHGGGVVHGLISHAPERRATLDELLRLGRVLLGHVLVRVIAR